jgi:hypothetical protein
MCIDMYPVQPDGIRKSEERVAVMPDQIGARLSAFCDPAGSRARDRKSHVNRGRGVGARTDGKGQGQTARVRESSANWRSGSGVQGGRTVLLFPCEPASEERESQYEFDDLDGRELSIRL